MPSPAERFTRLQKVAIFLIVLGEKKAREILADLDLETVEHINAAIRSLGAVTPQEKAGVMIEFGDFFYKDKPLSAKLATPPKKAPAKSAPAKAKPAAPKAKATPPPAQTPPPPQADEKKILETLQTLRERVDPGKIDWSRAGYDFGEGFKGPSGRPR